MDRLKDDIKSDEGFREMARDALIEQRNLGNISSPVKPPDQAKDSNDGIFSFFTGPFG